MSNVSRLRPKANASQSMFPNDPEFATHASTLSGNPRKPEVKEAIRKAVLLLDIAVQHAGQASRIINDPKTTTDLNDCLAIIEDLLQLVRTNVQKL